MTASLLSPEVAPRPTAARQQAGAQFLRFGAVGTICFAVDTAVVYSLRGAVGLIPAGFASFAVAATAGWVLNRRWTFRDRPRRSAHRQWAAALLANLVGIVPNRGTYVVLVTAFPLCQALPALPLAAGAVAGMFVNFALARRVVFR